MPWFCVAQWVLVTVGLSRMNNKYGKFIKGSVRFSLISMHFLFMVLTSLEVYVYISHNEKVDQHFLDNFREIQVFKAIFYYNIFSLKTVELFMKADETNCN